jgi:subtilisin family serine protease
MTLQRTLLATLAGILLGTGTFATTAAAAATLADPIVVRSAADLPRFSYPVKGTATALVESDDAAFQAFAQQVRRDVESTLASYRIEDKSTLSELLNTRLDLQELAGEYAAGLKTIEALRALEQKPAAKLLTGLFAQARLQAALDAGAAGGPAYEAAFRRRYAELVAPLPWAVVQDGIRGGFGASFTASRAALVARVTTDLDPAAARSGALDAGQAGELVGLRLALKAVLPVSAARGDVLRAYIAKNEVPKPDIWAAREFTLTAADKVVPVNVAIWDSGVDVSLFPNQLFTDPAPTASGAHGLAFDDLGHASTDWLFPITDADKAAYPAFREMIQGRLDLQNGVDSPAARSVRKKFQTMSPAEMHAMFEANKVLSHYAHGTHCAGIAVRGNPAARLVVARFNDQLPDLPFAPTEAWARQMGAAFKQMGDYFRTRHVRVVNMSWGDDAQEFETWLSKTGGGADPVARKANAAALFALWKKAIQDAIRSSPDTLFVTAAGNSDSNVAFIEDVPSSLREPNLLTVGAVNQAGDETSFTSHGEAVVVHASGYQVESFVPGGARLPFSGTSMAAPNVVNLAAKLFALDPTLTPAQVIDLIRHGATESADGRRHLIDQTRSVALLRAAKTTN